MASKTIDKRRRAQLDRSLAELANLPDPPPRGWIRAVRTALGMSMRQMAERMGAASSTTVAQSEASEASGGISLRTLRAAADALECDVVYALVPRRGSLSASIRSQAMRIATEAVGHADTHMVLEAQGVVVERRAELIAEIADELERGSLRKLWDAPG